MVPLFMSADSDWQFFPEQEQAAISYGSNAA